MILLRTKLYFFINKIKIKWTFNGDTKVSEIRKRDDIARIMLVIISYDVFLQLSFCERVTLHQEKFHWRDNDKYSYLLL